MMAPDDLDTPAPTEAPIRVLVVEDELLIGLDLVMLLEEWGYATSGPHRTPDAALRAIASDPPHLAVLDMNLGDGRTSLPVAETLAAAGTPFVFLSGYSLPHHVDHEATRNAPRLRKPVTEGALRDVLTRIAPKRA